MRETAHTAPTAEPSERDRLEARHRRREASWDTDADDETVLAQAICDARLAGFAAGLEERADEAHLAGYREGLVEGYEQGLAAARADEQLEALHTATTADERGEA